MRKQKLPSPEDYIYDLYFLAEQYKDAALTLQKDIIKSFLELMPVIFPVAFLAAHAAELYLKSLILAFEKPSPSKTTLRRLKNDKELRHNLEKLLDLLMVNCYEARALTNVIRTLNKYSGTNMRYLEFAYKKSPVIGTDEISRVSEVAIFAKKKLTERRLISEHVSETKKTDQTSRSRLE